MGETPDSPARESGCCQASDGRHSLPNALGVVGSELGLQAIIIFSLGFFNGTFKLVPGFFNSLFVVTLKGFVFLQPEDFNFLFWIIVMYDVD